MSTPILIVLIVATLAFSVGFLLLVLTLVPAIQQFKALMVDLEKTSIEVRDLARESKRLAGAAQERLEQVETVLAQGRKTVENVGDTLHFINANVLRRSAGLLAFLPAVKMGWSLVKKFKGGK